MMVVLTGLAAGVLHVLVGPDHIAALAPVALDKPKHALRIGLRWGFGHGVSVVCLGALGIFFKNAVDLKQISSIAEFSVGFMLIGIGMWAMRRAHGFTLHAHQHVHDDGPEHQHIHIHPTGTDSAHEHTTHDHAAFSVGLLHGAAGSGQLFGLLPALALEQTQAIVYLTAYLVATIATMSAVGLSLGWLMRKGGQKNFRILLYTSATASLIIGVFWLWQSWATL
jgi:hypothetical protein